MYIEEIDIKEFQAIFKSHYPIITLEIIKYITHFSLAASTKVGGAGGIDYTKIHKENK